MQPCTALRTSKIHAKNLTCLLRVQQSSQRTIGCHQYATTRRRAPSTVARDRRDNSRTERLLNQNQSQRLVQEYNKAFNGSVRQLHKSGAITATVEQVAKFWESLERLLQTSRRHQAFTLQSFKSVQEECGVNDEDSLSLARMVTRLGMPKDISDDPTISIFIAKTLSESGYVPATIWVMGSVCESARISRDALSASSIAKSYRHLRQVANDPDGDFQAKTLLGRIENLLGNENRAISLWQDAIRVMNTQKLETDGHADPMDRFKISNFVRQPDHFQLRTPYIELALIHNLRSRRGLNEMEASKQALDEGCRQDDPWSHYHKSVHAKVLSPDGDHLATSDWMYHVTKAAASGHAKAMYDLGVFYAESGWKYLENEPPDHVKPTPFDSYPSFSEPSLLDLVKRWLGLQREPEISQQDELFRTAAFPATARQRMSLAFDWLMASVFEGYAPACIYLAKICLQERLWSAATAPSSAMSLSEERYKFASQADYEARNPSFSTYIKDIGVDEPNRGYSRYLAAFCLARFIYAEIADQKYKEMAASAGSNKSVLRNSEQVMMSEMDPRITSWWINAGIRESYESMMPAMSLEARKICDEERLDLYGAHGEELYLYDRS